MNRQTGLQATRTDAGPYRHPSDNPPFCISDEAVGALLSTNQTTLVNCFGA
jgi:hypothetical protein